MSKEYTTLEMINELDVTKYTVFKTYDCDGEYIKAKRDGSGGIYITFKNGTIKDLSLNADVMDYLWEKENEPITYMQAADLYINKIKVKSILKQCERIYDPNINKTIARMVDKNGITPTLEEILEGTWYILD